MHHVRLQQKVPQVSPHVLTADARPETKRKKGAPNDQEAVTATPKKRKRASKDSTTPNPVDPATIREDSPKKAAKMAKKERTVQSEEETTSDALRGDEATE